MIHFDKIKWKNSQSAASSVLDQSALQIVQKLDNWNPGVQRGKPVKVNLTVPVKFN